MLVSPFVLPTENFCHKVLIISFRTHLLLPRSLELFVRFVLVCDRANATGLAACHVIIYQDLQRPSANIDMDSKNPFLKPFKGLKRRLTRGSRKREGKFGSESGREGRETDTEGSDTSRRNSQQHPRVEGVVESGPSREANSEGKAVQADPPTSAPSISHDEDPNGMWITFFQL